MAAHKQVIKEHGAVWLGKMGKTLGGKHILTMDKQRAEGIPTFLYLVQRVGSKYEVFRGTTLEIKKGLPERELVPKYYFKEEMFKYISVWIKLSKIESVDSTILNNLMVQSSGMPIGDTLTKSMAAMFVVRKRLHI